ncbi:GNAT family N-acetyltransferase [Dactylosporangium sp. CS-047395]|uniref:GNAT family N-acetyltransferase n=1 Tax=Dactylosporangium sp. CS-047395 TaxID=3239936 RepID=UPI003D8F6A38
MELTVRGSSLRDVAAILSITRASDIASTGEPDWTEDEVVATLTAPDLDPAVDTWLAFGPDGSPLAWAYVDNPERSERDNVEVYAVPGAGPFTFGPLLDLALARIAERGAAIVQAGVVPAEIAYVEALTARGFAFRLRRARMTRELTGQERPPDARFGVRVMREDDLPRFHEVFQTAFADLADHVPQDFATWRASLAALPSVSWDEWLVAESGGVIVGILQSSDQGVERGEGWVKNLAVLREHRGTGIGRALLEAAFAVYAAKGRTTAGLGVDVTNPTGAYQLYTSAGLTAAFAADMYELVR